MEKTVRELKVIEALTERDNLKNAVRDNLKNQTEVNLLKDWDKENDGSYTYPLVQDVNGTIVKARVQLTITVLETFKGKGTKKEEEETEIPSLF